MKIFLISIVLVFFAYNITSCNKKDEFLSKKPQESLSTITNLKSAKLVLDNEYLFNYQIYPTLGESSSDDYYVSDQSWLQAFNTDQNLYIWSKEIFPIDYNSPDWSSPYNQVFACNVVLDAIKKINISNAEQSEFNRIKGTALLFRAYTFYRLVQTFALPYNPRTASNLPGIPIRLTSDLNEKSSRSSIEECYNQILLDLKVAANLLPQEVERISLPNKAAAYGLLSRIYIALSDYRNCKLYSDSCLLIKNKVTNFNGIVPDNLTITSPGSPYFEEDIFHTSMPTLGLTNPFSLIVDSTLYSLYENDDLRKELFFVESQGSLRYRGSFEFHLFGDLFSGITTSEIFLNRSECFARNGEIVDAMNDINKVLEKRYKQGTFVPKTATSTDEALEMILLERRKELCFRGIRWTDLRRLNFDPKYAKTLKRIIDGKNFFLPPNDLKYALPIPYNEILLSGIQQNDR